MNLPYERIRHLLIDLDGVLYRGDTALNGAMDFIQWLRQRGITFRLVTNNSTLTPEQYTRKLAAMGIEVSPEDVFTSALATALYLKKHAPDARSAYVIGEQGLVTALEDIGLHITDEGPDWVISGLDRHVTYEKLAIGALAIRAGARFLGTNPDTSLPTERGLLPGAGAIQAALTATTGVAPVIVGKPEPVMLDLAMEMLGGTPSTTAMLGDRLDTDIQGAMAAGLPSIMILTGVSTQSDLESSSFQPSAVVEDLPDLMDTWSRCVAR